MTTNDTRQSRFAEAKLTFCTIRRGHNEAKGCDVFSEKTDQAIEDALTLCDKIERGEVVVVPVEPSGNMNDAGADEYCAIKHHEINLTSTNPAIAIYKAMIAAHKTDATVPEGDL